MSTSSRPRASFLFRVFRTTLLTVAVALGYLMFTQTKYIYFPGPVGEAEVRGFLGRGGVRIDYRTSQGAQTAWLKPAAGEKEPERFWIVCAGNGSLALDLSDVPETAGLTNDAFLFVDYPGYGACEGKPSPEAIRENLRAAVPASLKAARFPESALATRGLVFGHSLGAAAALSAAEEWRIPRAVLLSPFTSSMDMAQVMFHVPLGWLVTHRFDNRAMLKSLTARGGRAWIIHGGQDEVIPVAMGRDLAASSPAVTFTEVPDGLHNNLLDTGWDPIAAAMKAAREEVKP